MPRIESIVIHQGPQGTPGLNGTLTPAAGQVVAGTGSGSTLTLPAGSVPSGTSAGPVVALPRDHINVMHPDFGAVGDGVTDDGPALRAAFAAGSAAAMPVLLPPAPGGFYAVGSKSPAGNEYFTVPANLTIMGYGAVLKTTWFNTNTWAPMLYIAQPNVRVYGLEIDGNVANDPVVTEAHHAILVDAGALNTVLTDLTPHHAKGDGIIVGNYGAPVQTSITNMNSHHNYRQGMSVIAAQTLTVIASRFTDTAGTAPANGLDIEVNTDTDVCTDLTFMGCAFLSNFGHGAAVSFADAPTARQEGVRFIGCLMADNGNSSTYSVSLAFSCGRDVDVIGCTLRGGPNTNDGLSLYARTNRNIRVLGGVIRDHQYNGIGGSALTKGLALIGVTIRNNSLLTPGSYYSASLANVDGLVVQGCRIGPDYGVADTQLGLRLNSTVTNYSVVGNDMHGANAMNDSGDHTSSWVVRGNIGALTEEQQTLPAAVTVANTTTRTDVLTYTRPYPTLVGQTFTLEFGGLLSCIATSGTLTFAVRGYGNSLLILSLVLPSQGAALTNAAFRGRVLLTVTTAGAAGRLQAVGELICNGTVITAAAQDVAINLSASPSSTYGDIRVSAQWQTANAGNTVTVNAATWELKSH